ncbi:MAG: helix-turn-helix domain-containing protein [Bifidobacteriaceae bacterium]|jgi:excisionase family DNA binding protein|nr:helix-turn-helix domain-containing protein [Bifidobacteriaceae bacterium]
MDTTAIASSPPRSETVLPPHDGATLTSLSAFVAEHEDQAKLTGPDGLSIALPQEVYEVLRHVIMAMSQGSAVTVAPVSMRLTTSQAADMLGISRPTLVRLLADGAIPFEQPRRHRLIRLDDLLAFQNRRRADQRAELAEATRQAAADGLYEDRIEDYAKHLKAARRDAAGA